MGKSQTESSGSSSASERGPAIIKVKNCNNCGAEYARKGTLCGSCRGIRHRLLKKVRENKILAAVNNNNLGATGNSPPHRNNNSNTVANNNTNNNNSKQTQGDDAFLELPPIQIPVPGRSTTPPFPCLPSPSVSVSGRDRLVNSVASCSSCDSNLPLECRMCFCLQLQVRRLQTEKLELQRQLAEMEIEIHAMKLQKMNGDRLQSFTETRILPSPSPSPTPSTLPSFDRDLFTLSQTSIHQLSSSHFSESTPLHGGVSVCQLVS